MNKPKSLKQHRWTLLYLSTLFVTLVSANLVIAAGSGDPVAGDEAFTKKCSGCHATKPTDNYYAPNLHCIIGRKAGSADFSGYSPDFKKVTQDLTWTEDLLFEYLRSQKEFVGNQLGYPDAQIMMNLEYPDPVFRKNVIAYLRSICTSD